MKINKILTHNLRNDAHFQFHSDFRDLVLKYGAQALKVKPQFDDYLPLYEREDEALKRIVKSAITEKIQEADRARDDVFAGMIKIVESACLQLNVAFREAAERVKVVTDTYGNVARKPLNEQTSAVHNLVQDLQSEKYAADAEVCGITEWISELETRNNAFETLMKERFDESAQKPHIVLREARGDVDAVYHEIVKRIDALIIVEGETAYESFVNTLNEIVAKYNIHRHHHHGHNQDVPPEEAGEV